MDSDAESRSSAGGGTPSRMAGSPSQRPQPRGILKTVRSMAAKKEVERAGLLASVRSEIVFKVLILGATASGKTALIRALCGEVQQDGYDPTPGGIESTTMLAATFNDVPVFLQLWEVPLHALRDRAADGSDSARGRLHADIVFSGVHAILIMFDATEGGASYASLATVDELRDEVETRLQMQAQQQALSLAAQAHRSSRAAEHPNASSESATTTILTAPPIGREAVARSSSSSLHAPDAASLAAPIASAAAAAVAPVYLLAHRADSIVLSPSALVSAANVVSLAREAIVGTGQTQHATLVTSRMAGAIAAILPSGQGGGGGQNSGGAAGGGGASGGGGGGASGSGGGGNFNLSGGSGGSGSGAAGGGQSNFNLGSTYGGGDGSSGSVRGGGGGSGPASSYSSSPYGSSSQSLSSAAAAAMGGGGSPFSSSLRGGGGGASSGTAGAKQAQQARPYGSYNIPQPHEFSYGLDASDLATYADDAGYTRWWYTATPPPSALVALQAFAAASGIASSSSGGGTSSSGSSGAGGASSSSGSDRRGGVSGSGGGASSSGGSSSSSSSIGGGGNSSGSGGGGGTTVSLLPALLSCVRTVASSIVDDCLDTWGYLDSANSSSAASGPRGASTGGGGVLAAGTSAASAAAAAADGDASIPTTGAAATLHAPSNALFPYLSDAFPGAAQPITTPGMWSALGILSLDPTTGAPSIAPPPLSPSSSSSLSPSSAANAAAAADAGSAGVSPADSSSSVVVTTVTPGASGSSSSASTDAASANLKLIVPGSDTSMSGAASLPLRRQWSTGIVELAGEEA